MYSRKHPSIALQLEANVPSGLPSLQLNNEDATVALVHLGGQLYALQE